jgi:arylsulfatase
VAPEDWSNRPADTTRIDQFPREGFQLLNIAPEARCSPSRSALMTGLHAICSRTHTAAMPDSP